MVTPEDRTTRIRVVIQARTSSSRLPGKVLLPISGVPIAVLVARRMLHHGLETVIATSTDCSDDTFALELGRAGIPFLRGSLSDVLGRFLLATEDMQDEDVCVRITADNIFPDGSFLKALFDEFVESGFDYMNASHSLPYGLAAEMFRVRTLRDAAAATSSDYDIEHVTPWIKRNCRCVMSKNDFGFGNIRRLRCTIDTLDDYVAMAPLFRPHADPVTAGFLDLTQALVASQPAQPVETPSLGDARPAFVLGTVQLGVAYGRNNKAGKPAVETALEIVKSAADHGVTQCDTARAYGDSERVVGLALKREAEPRITPITKLAPLPANLSELPPRVVTDLIEGSVYRSLFELQMKRLPVLLLHRAAHVDMNDGLIWNRLKQFREEGLIGKLGASVQSPQELAMVLDHPEVEHVQLPFNMLDRRWDGFFGSRRSGLTVHVRSVFLQGLLATDDAGVWPKIEGLKPREIIGRIGDLVSHFGRESRVDLCLAFARAAGWIDGIVLGLETMEQLSENLRLFDRPALSPHQYEEARAAFGSVPEQLLDPSRWG